MTTRQALASFAREHGSDWIGEMIVWLGDLSGVVETGVSGRYYARQANGQVITVSNMAQAAPIFDLRVLVRRSRIQPNIWQIFQVVEDYDVPAAGGDIAYHAAQHEEEGSDRLALDRKQIKQLSVRVSGTWEVTVYGSTVLTANGIVFIDNQTVDLSAYPVTVGAKFVSIESDEDGALSLNEGDPFASWESATAADIPVPDPGKYMIAYVLFHEGQEELADNNIRVPMPLAFPPSNVGAQIAGADPDTPEAGDLFVFWDIVDEALKSISWAGIVAALTAIFDLLYQPIGDYIEDAPSDGNLYGRKDSAWEIVSESSGGGGVGSHLHGLARWNGAAGQATFELPDFWEYVDSVMINGLEEDPLAYSLSSDGSQVVFDTGLASDSIITAHGVIRTI